MPAADWTPSLWARSDNQLGFAGWAAVADALEHVTSLTSLNGCDQYASIRAGGLAEMNLGGKGLEVWAARFLERSASTLTRLDLRCVRHENILYFPAPLLSRHHAPDTG